MDVASGADRPLDILQVVVSPSLVSVIFREAFGHPYISFFNLLVNGYSVIYVYLVATFFPKKCKTVIVKCYALIFIPLALH